MEFTLGIFFPGSNVIFLLQLYHILCASVKLGPGEQRHSLARVFFPLFRLLAVPTNLVLLRRLSAVTPDVEQPEVPLRF